MLVKIMMRKKKYDDYDDMYGDVNENHDDIDYDDEEKNMTILDMRLKL